MKKIIALLLCAALLLPMALNTGAVYAAETPAIVCEDVTCSPGEQVTVEVTVANNPGFAYLELTPQYASELSLAKVQNGDLVSDFTKGKQYVWVADEDVTDDGLLLTFTFDVADTVPAGEYSVDFILRACYNYDEESVQFSIQSGTVKVVSAAGAGNVVVEKEDGTSESYADLQAAVGAFGGTDKAVVLQSSVTEDITVDQSVVLDLNGCTLTGSVSGSGTLTVKDSKTDDFDVEDGEGYGVITGTAENVVPAEGYVKIVENGETSIHKVDLTIKNMTLRPEETGLYFKSDFAGDQVVARNVDSFGVALSVTGEPDETTLQNPLHFTRYEKEAFGTGADNTSTLLTGILKETNGYNTNQRNAKIKVYGRAYIEVDGVVTFGACQSRSMREQLEGIDGKWSQLDDAQKSGILAMYDTYKMVMRGWELPNIKANLS